MRAPKILYLVVTLALLVSALPMGAVDAQPGAQDLLAKVEPLVIEELAASGRIDYFIWLAEKADLTPVGRLQTKQEKGYLVYETLQATAERTQRDLRAWLDRQGVRYEAYYIANKVLVYDGTSEVLQAVIARPDVVQVTANHHYQLQEPVRGSDPGQTQAVEANITFIKAPQAWALGYTGQGTVLADNDTGLDETHPAIARHYRGCLNPPACTSWNHNYNWWDATSTYPNDPFDGNGHGTHTTGTMIGDDGGTNQIGVAPGARTIHCKNMDNGGSGSDATFIACFQWDLAPWDLNHQNPRPDLAPDAVNNSWGYLSGGQNQFRDEIQALHAAGILVEVSAGNEGPNCATLRSPGDYNEVLTTGSVNHANAYPGTITGFSSRGPSDLDPSPPNYFPDIMAPGENIRSSTPNNQYAIGNGTSMAGPHATALVGLLWSACPAYRGRVAETLGIIHETAAPLVGQGGSNCGGNYTTGPNNDWGYGTIDALAAVNAIRALCTESGWLDGHVVDAFTGNPIVTATVLIDRTEGGSWSDTTDATGYYTLSIPNGSLNITATHPMYTPAFTVAVVITDSVTHVDFALRPRGRLYGYITDQDNGFPLAAATVTAEDGTEGSTNQSGFYELYLDPGLHTVTATAGNYAPGGATVTMTAGQDTRQDFSLLAQVSLIPAPVHEYVLLTTNSTATAQLVNRRSTPYAFRLFEIPGGYRPGLNSAWPGPDGYGYTGEATDYNWIDIRSSGIPIPGLTDDSYTGPLPIGFTFSFYGTDYTQFYVSSNGRVELGGGSNDAYPDCPFPNANAPNNVIALMWDDLRPNYTSGGLYYQQFATCPVGMGSCLVVEYYNWGLWPWDVAGTFEAILFDNGSVQVQYLDGGDGEGELSAAGIEGNNAPADYGLLYSCYEWGSLHDGLSICYIYPGSTGCEMVQVPWLGETPVQGAAPANGSAELTLYFSATASVGVTQTGDYYATLLVNGSPQLRVPVTMTVIDEFVPPVASFESSTPACTGGEVHFTNTSDLGVPPAQDFLWAFGDGFTSTLMSPVHVYGAVGNYTVTMQLCNPAGCDAASGTVEVGPGPVADFAYMVDELTLTLTNTSQYAAAYLWEFGDGFTSTLENPVHTYLTSGSYTVTLTAISDCRTDVRSVAIVAGLAPTAGFTSSAPGCPGEGISFTNTTTGTAPIEYLWDMGDGTTSTETNPLHAYAAAGSYTVTLEAENSFGVDRASAVVQVGPLPVAGFSFQTGGLVVTLTNSSQNATSYLWAFGDGITSTLVNPVHTYSTVGTYTVTLQATGECGVDEYSATVIVSVAPVAGFTSSSPVCLGEAMFFTNTSAGAPPMAFLWEFGDGITDTVRDPVHSYTAAGGYTVTLTAENGLGSDTASAPVEVRPLPVADFISDVHGLVVTLTNASRNTFSYWWSFGDGATSTETSPIHTYATAGDYTVTLTASGPCGQSEMSQALRLTQCDQVEIVTVTVSATGCLVTLTPLVTGDAPVEYEWDLGAWGTSTETVPIVDLAATGSYSMTLRVWNCAGVGYDRLSFEVQVGCGASWQIYLPIVVRRG